MDLTLFETINKQLRPYTKELAYHMVGDPLVLSNLDKYLDISFENGLKVNITTTANNLNEKMFKNLMHKAIRQINFSLNSYNANSHKKTLDEYLEPIFSFTKYALKQKQHFFINFRIWNLDEDESAKVFNKEVFDKTNKYFNTSLEIEDIYDNKPKSIRVDNKVLFNFDDYFEWPNIENEYIGDKGFCYGLDSHFGILSSGKVVPCCLDKDGVIDLGNLNETSLEDIMSSKRVYTIQDGFKNNMVTEELCQKCDYRTRFD